MFKIIVIGDGSNVVFNIYDKYNNLKDGIVKSKLEARKFAKEIQDAADMPEPNCKDPTDHFHGHCGCK